MTDFWLGFCVCLSAIFATVGILFLTWAAAEWSDRSTDADVRRLRRRKQAAADATPRGLNGGRRA